MGSPRVSGAALRAVLSALKLGPFRRTFVNMMKKDLGIAALADLPESLRGPIPIPLHPLAARASHARPSQDLGALPVQAWPRSTLSYATAYAAGKITPREVVERAFAAARRFAAMKPSLGPIHVYDEARGLRDADAATERHRAFRALGPLDGVPVVIKEEIDVLGLATRLGTSWLPETGAPADATSVARLRGAGAIVLGHSPMTEYGMSPLGANGHRPMPRNPHDPRRLAGGSSTGSGVAVATGVSPVAIGADGGGSIRTPAAHCGVFGLKTSLGRVSRKGHGIAGTVTVQGPIASSAADIAIAMETIGPEDPDDPRTRGVPPIEPGSLVAATGRGVKGLRIGVDDSEWAEAGDDVARSGRAALGALEKEGAVLHPVKMKLARHAASMGYLTIGLEEYADLREARLAHDAELGTDLRVNLRALGAFDAGDYLDAQRLRAGLRQETAEVLRDVDVLALPSVGMTATAVTDAEAAGGFLDAAVLHAHCRFAFLANLTGLPAGSAPVGMDRDGLPIGLQIVGDAWDEACVIAVLAHLERTGAAHVDRPKTFVDLLEGT